MLRKKFFDDLERVARGQDPKGVVRDPAINHCVSLPIAHRRAFVEGMSLEALLKHPIFSTQLAGYVFQMGQPEEIRRQYEEAMGIGFMVKSVRR